MAAIRDGLGRVRVAGEAIYQRRRKDREVERKRYPLQRVASPPMVAVTTPFLVLSSFHSLPLSPPRLIPGFPLSPRCTSSSYRLCSPLDRDHPPPLTSPLTRPCGALGSVHESINVGGD